MSLPDEKLVMPENMGDSDGKREVDKIFGMNSNPPSQYEDVPPFFFKLDFEIIDSICEEGSKLVEGVKYVQTDSSGLRKGLVFESKKDLQLAVKNCCIAQHYQIVVVESSQSIWNVKCKRWNEGCKWRLRACRRKTHGMFEITKFGEDHSCL